MYLKNIADILASLRSEVEVHNAVNLYDINIISESFYAGLLNIVEGLELVNANAVGRNAAGVDLIDDNNRIAVQVTADSSSTKIRHTIDEFISNRLYERYSRLVILILTQKKRYTAEFDCRGLFQFDKNMDIRDVGDLMKKINTLDTAKLEKINVFLNREFHDKGGDYEPTEASEVETIMDLIEVISSNKNVSIRERDAVVDPEYKIYRRFREFADSLMSQYKTLLAVYGTALNTVETVRGSDDAQDIITMLYLRDLSVRFLDEAENDPVKALNALVDFFEKKLGRNGKKYDSMAIKFYLINEMIKCSVFPNEGGQMS